MTYQDKAPYASMPHCSALRKDASVAQETYTITLHCMYLYSFIYMFIYLYTYIRTCVCVYVYTYIYMYVYVDTHIYTYICKQKPIKDIHMSTEKD